MSVLNNINFINDLEGTSTKLSETPARLKLRNRTLNGINYNMAKIDAIESIFSIPQADLAKKKKKVEELIKENKDEVKIEDIPVIENQITEEKIVEEPVVNEEVVTIEKEDTMINATILPEVITSENNSRQLRASSYKVENMGINGLRMMNEIKPEIKEETEEVNDVKEEYNIEQGLIGEVASVDDYTNSEQVENSPIVEQQREKEQTAIEEASEEVIFEETTKLKDEITDLQKANNSVQNDLTTFKNEYEKVIEIGNELEDTLRKKQQEKLEKKKMFYEVAGKQKEMMKQYKERLIANQQAYFQEIDEYDSKIKEATERNSQTEQLVDKENSEISKYDDLINAINSFDVPEVENSFEKRMIS